MVAPGHKLFYTYSVTLWGNKLAQKIDVDKFWYVNNFGKL